MYKWEIRNKYDKDSNGCSVGKNNFTTHRMAVNDLLKEINSGESMLKYELGEKERVETIITVKSYKEK
jgi:hypothetical protein